MQITIIGTGYVGLVTGIGLSEVGNHVTCVDIDTKKIEALNYATKPLYHSANKRNNPGSNIIFHPHKINKYDRSDIKGHKPCVIWLTGLSGSGKSTIANALEEKLNRMKVHTYLLDGDNIRHGLNKDLGFSIEDRKENIRRIGEVAKLFVDAGLIVTTAFISPLREDRDYARTLVEKDEFIEVYVDAPLEICEQRDPKGLYKKAREGKIKDFTGIDSPYEPPENPEIHIRTEELTIEESVEKIINYLKSNRIIES